MYVYKYVYISISMCEYVSIYEYVSVNAHVCLLLPVSVSMSSCLCADMVDHHYGSNSWRENWQWSHHDCASNVDLFVGKTERLLSTPNLYFLVIKASSAHYWKIVQLIN